MKGPGAAISGIEWGIFIALAVAAWLTYAGHRIRVAHLPARPPSDEQPTDSFEVVQPPRSEGQTRRPPRPKRLPADQLTIPIDERSWD